MNENQYGEFVGIEDLYVAKITADDENNYTTEAPRYLAPTSEVAGQPKENKKITSYDNKMHRIYVTEGETEVTITVPGLTAQDLAELMGKFRDSNDGRVYDSGQSKKPYYAVGFRYSIGDGEDYRYMWFLKGIFMAGSEDAKTKTENVEVKTYQLTFVAIPTTHKFTYDGKTKPIKRVYGDTVDAAFAETGWFTQVQTPDTSGAPDAIALSSIVPADDAVDVAVDTNIVITFNNPIKSEEINVIDTSTGSIVSVSKSWNTERTILTMSHAAAFNNDALHNVVIAGVKDDYGQELAAVIKDFTTVAA